MSSIKLESSFIKGDMCQPEELMSHVYGDEFLVWKEQGSLDPENDSRLLSQLQQLYEEGLSLMGARHGSGYPDYYFDASHPQAVKNLLYNNAHHAANFAEDIKNISAYSGVSLPSIAVRRVAAAWHDIDQTTVIDGRSRTGEDETSSTLQMLEQMREFKIPPSYALEGAYVIQATQVITDKSGNVLGQHGGMGPGGPVTPDDAYPTMRLLQAARYGAASDLGRLFDPLSQTYADALFLQRRSTDEDDDFMHAYVKYKRDQVTFLTNYRYSSPEAEKLFGTQRKPVIAYATHILLGLETGNLTFVEVQERNAAYAKDPFGYLERHHVMLEKN